MPESFGSDETLMKSSELPAPQKVQWGFYCVICCITSRGLWIRSTNSYNRRDSILLKRKLSSGIGRALADDLAVLIKQQHS